MIQGTKEPQRLDSEVLAEYIAKRIGAVSHLKLQKLLYYVQAYHLAYFDQKIVNDPFEAWAHGPVSRKIYDALKDRAKLYTEVEYKQLPGEADPEDLMKKQLTKEQLELVDDVLSEFGPLSGLQLENLTHEESPWIEARKGYDAGDRCNVEILPESMRIFYKAQLFDGETQTKTA